MSEVIRYYVEARPGRDVRSQRVHARDCRYLTGPVMEVQYLQGKRPEDVVKMQNVCNVCIGSNRFQTQGADYKRQRTTNDKD